MDKDMYIGIDIGGTKCAVILGDSDAHFYGRIEFPTETSKGYEHSIHLIIHAIEQLLDNNELVIENIKSMGISCGGPLDSKRGIILSPPNLPGWDNVPIVEILEKRFNKKTYLQNDANACAYGEWKFGAGKGCDNMIFLTFGTGLGAGLILNGKLYAGTNDMAGEVGHIRLADFGPVGYGKAGSFEGFCSGGGIAQLGKLKATEKLQMGEQVSFCDDLDGINARILGKAADSGDELAKEIFKISGYYLGKGLSILVDLLNPERIIIGSIFARCKHLLWPEAEKVIKTECLAYSRDVCSILPAALGEEVGDYAAIAVAMLE